MRELYHKFFDIPPQEKVQDKVLLVRVAMLVTIVLLCLAAMSVTAYAYFTYTITSAPNLIGAAHFDVEVFVRDIGTDVTSIEDDYNALLGEGTYEVTLKKAGTASTGFCVVTAKDLNDPSRELVYHTQQLGLVVNPGEETPTETNEITFTVQVQGGGAEFTFAPHWGTSSSYADYQSSDPQNDEKYILHGETVTVQTTGGSDPIGDDPDDEQGGDIPDIPADSDQPPVPDETTPPGDPDQGGGQEDVQPDDTPTEPDPSPDPSDEGGDQEGGIPGTDPGTGEPTP